MKKIISTLLAIILVMGMIVPMAITASADEPAVWDGKANIKWYFDGEAEGTGIYKINTAADLAGFAYLVNASCENNSVVTGVYYDADYNVLGYRAGAQFSARKLPAFVSYTPTANDGSQVTVGDTFVGKKVKLCADIVLNTGDASTWGENAPANNWSPIGIAHDDESWDNVPKFIGSFDGQGYTISGMYVNTTRSDAKDWAVGLFGLVAIKSVAEIKNVSIDNFYVTGSLNVGGFVGRTKGALTIENCYASNGYIVAAKEQQGTFVASTTEGAFTLENCGVDNVTLKGAKKIGALIGLELSSPVTLINCYAKATIEGENYGGALIGATKDGSVTVENAYSVVNINTTAVDAETQAPAGKAGIICGLVEGGTTVAASNYYYVKNAVAGTIIDETTEGTSAITLESITGDAAKATLSGFDFDYVWKTVADNTPVIELRESDDAGEDEGGFEYEDDGEDDNKGNGGSTTTTKPADTSSDKDSSTTDTEAAAAKSGCGSSIGIASVAIMALVSGAAVVIGKKED